MHARGAQTNKPALLAMANGMVFHGYSVGAGVLATGELVFNTAMSGYQEILSDPSYNSQILTFTCPHIGNVGINPGDWESDEFQVSAVVLHMEYPMIAGHRGTEQLGEALNKRGIPAIAGVDTRHITQILREQGSMGACVDAGSAQLTDKALKAAREFEGISGKDLSGKVSGSYAEKPAWNEGGWLPSGSFRQPKDLPYQVVVYDFGVKRSILRMLVDAGCSVHIVEAHTPAEQVLAMKPHGVVLSNGPGDPAACTYAIENIHKLMQAGMPLLGICLGYQMLAHACGGRTLKMKFGHHGANHPVQRIDDGSVWVTSQNHGFAVDEKTLPDSLEATHRSLFDGTLQGIRHKTLPAMGFQGHPEAGPGPHDASSIFKDFIASIKSDAPKTAIA
jgi:carbamoyl-phosphate synthase small subunit